MEKDVFSRKMLEPLKDLQIELNKEQIEQFYLYMNLLLEWNQKINLTAIVEPEEIIQKHFIDSLTISKYISENARIVDVGTGAGFPGIPLSIVRKDLDNVLLDSLNKRVNFLNEVIDKLKLSKVQAIHTRVEEFAKNKNYREKFDYATSRAVANLSTLSEYLLPLVKVGGRCICMKGSEIEEELEHSQGAICLLGGKIERVDKFVLPKSDIGRNVVLIAKKKNTLLKYPRKAGIPAKKPLL